MQRRMTRKRKALVQSLNRLVVCQNLRSLRLRRGYTQTDMAVKLDLSQNGYSKIETGSTNLTLAMLITISELFDMELDELTTELIGGAISRS